MSESPGPSGARSLVLRVSVPADRDYRAVVTELAKKVAEYLGISEPDAESAGAMLEGLAATVAPQEAVDQDRDITFEFRQADGDLLIEARCAGRSSEARHPLPA